MAKIIKFGKWVRNNWKKSVFFSAAASYGANFANTEHEKNLLLRKYCGETAKYGEVPLAVFQSPRHLLVILNPTANKEKAKKDYEKYCAPLLHLSGVKVTVLNTAARYDATNLTNQVTDDFDAVIVAGGDGTISEVVTGLIRRKKEGTLNRKIPLGIIPLGKYNHFAKSLYVSNNLPEERNKELTRVRLMMDALVSIVKEVANPVHVMEIETLQESDEKSKFVYAVKDLHWGAFRDAHSNMDKYWYFGKLRKYAAYVFGSHRLNSPVTGQLLYTPPCSGCSKCYQTRMDTKPEGQRIETKRWWHSFIPRSSQSHNNLPALVDYNRIENKQCSLISGKPIRTVDFRISPSVSNGTPALLIETGPETVGYFQFVKDGWSREDDNPSALPKEQVHAQGATITPLTEPEKSTQVDKRLSVDNENYEVKPVRITLFHNALPVFYTLNN